MKEPEYQNRISEPAVLDYSSALLRTTSNAARPSSTAQEMLLSTLL
jgi:hypothetical protein